MLSLHNKRKEGEMVNQCAGMKGKSKYTKQVRSFIFPLTTYYNKDLGFTLLEVMIAVAILAIALVAVFGLQSQSVSLASEAKFNTTVALLAQKKMAQIESISPQELNSDDGDFGEDFPGYQWDVRISDVSFSGIGTVEYLKQVDLVIFWGDHKKYQYGVRLFRFVPKTKS
jgi:general secretion pathway protein I